LLETETTAIIDWITAGGGGDVSLWEIVSPSPGHTETFGEELGRQLAPGDVVSLVGELGAGKTVFVRGVARGLGCDGVSSPSFLIVQEYLGRYPVFHCDFYRLWTVRELEEIGWEEYLGGRGIVLIEWGNLIPEALPAEFLEVRIDPVEYSGCNRRLQFIPGGGRYQMLVKELSQRFGSLE
jgi:tRNA threonylcarbamoyladenosine biosynthesis protein TsaE